MDKTLANGGSILHRNLQAEAFFDCCVIEFLTEFLHPKDYGLKDSELRTQDSGENQEEMNARSLLLNSES